MQYSFSISEELQQELRWPERFAANPTYWPTLRMWPIVSRRDIEFETTVTAGRYNEITALWELCTDRWTDDYERGWKENYAALRRKARTDTMAGSLYEKSTHKGHDTSPEERQREYERRWKQGGANFMHSFDNEVAAQTDNCAKRLSCRIQ